MTLASCKVRRDELFNKMADNSVALLKAAPIFHRNSDTEFPFRQDSHFYYLTAFNETEAIALLSKKAGKNTFILFCQEKDPLIERWTGKRVGQKDACDIYGADEAYPVSELDNKMPGFLANANAIYYLTGIDTHFDNQIFSWVERLRKKVRQGLNAPHQFIDLRQFIDEQRLIKSSDELKYMQKAASISAKAHSKAMSQCKIGMYEYQLEAVLLYEFYAQGSRSPAYPCIVATGNNACTLHYTQNNAVIKEGDLVLIDAGAEFEGYAADITRTFPANGKFTASQQAIYELVLATQEAAILQAKPGMTWDSMQNAILKVMVQGLVDLKILQGQVQTLIEEKAYLPFYMHNSGHWLGMDVHDVGEYKIAGIWRKLSSGMVFTIEPGIYISRENTTVDEKWRGIGVRIEDDIVITDSGCDILTKELVKTPQEIEKLMQKRASDV
ncbi:MAG: Xaa-Pro aminopeptidase [Proteobacteria bacterium]|nr:Xaa-Pro aminopeptidase [Pseudomonadota bacterium]